MKKKNNKGESGIRLHYSMPLTSMACIKKYRTGKVIASGVIPGPQIFVFFKWIELNFFVFFSSQRIWFVKINVYSVK